MKTTELKKIIKEAVKEAIQEEMKDILLEAVRAPKGGSVGQSFEQPITENKSNIQEQKAARQAIMQQMMGGNGNMTLTSSDVNTFQPRGMVGGAAAEGSALPDGNVGLQQIMGLMNGK